MHGMLWELETNIHLETGSHSQPVECQASTAVHAEDGDTEMTDKALCKLVF
jgi:hypothetical protein